MASHKNSMKYLEKNEHLSWNFKKIAKERTLLNSVNEAVIILISEYVLCEKIIYIGV